MLAVTQLATILAIYSMVGSKKQNNHLPREFFSKNFLKINSLVEYFIFGLLFYQNSYSTLF